MNHDTRKLIGAFLLSVGLVGMVAFVARTAFAEDAPSAAAYEASDRIKEITPQIWELDKERKALETELKAAYDLISEEGWQYDFATGHFTKSLLKPAAPQPVGKRGYDVVRVCKAIAFAETSNCTTGTGLTKNNCHGIMTWARGYRETKRYSSTEESFRDCERIWSKNYGGMPHEIKKGTNRTMADVWTGGDKTASWLENFNYAYSTH